MDDITHQYEEDVNSFRSYSKLFVHVVFLQKGLTNNHLATIEAIFYAVHEVAGGRSQNGLDELMFWFYYFRSKVTEPSKRQNKLNLGNVTQLSDVT